MRCVIQRAYSTELKPTADQINMLRQCCGAARFVYNWALDYTEQVYQETGKHPHHYQVRTAFDAIKDELCRDEDGHVWIRDLPSKIIETECKNLAMAYQRFFTLTKQQGYQFSRRPNGSLKRKDGKPDHFPRRKSRFHDRQSFRVRGHIAIDTGAIRLPVIGWIKLWRKDYLPTSGIKINSATVSHRAGKWFVSIQCEQEMDIKPAKGAPIGVDVGIHTLAAVSDGRLYENPKAFRQYEDKIKRLKRQRAKMYEMNKNSPDWQRKNYDKLSAEIARLEYKVACIRRNAIHEATAGIVNKGARSRKRPRVIVIEDLNIKGMMQNGKLAKAIGDASMGELHRQLAYKAAWNGIELVKSDRWFASSKTCSRCGQINQGLTLADRTFRCPHCGYVIHRDVNAAQNEVIWYERQR